MHTDTMTLFHHPPSLIYVLCDLTVLLAITDSFFFKFSHDWGKDKMGRDNHSRVVRVCRVCRAIGKLVEGSFDEKFMQGDIDAGIDESCLSCNDIDRSSSSPI